MTTNNNVPEAELLRDDMPEFTDEPHRWTIEPHPNRDFDTLVTNSDEEARYWIGEIAESHLWDTNEGDERAMSVSMNPAIPNAPPPDWLAGNTRRTVPPAVPLDAREAPMWCFEAAMGVLGFIADGKTNPETLAELISKHYHANALPPYTTTPVAAQPVGGTRISDKLWNTHAQPVLISREDAVKAIRFEKYSNRGEDVPDSDPHSDNHPDYERAMIDEFLEYAADRVADIPPYPNAQPSPDTDARERAQKIAEQFSSFDGCHRAHLSDVITKAIEDAVATALTTAPATSGPLDAESIRNAALEEAAKVAETRWATLSVGKVSIDRQAEVERGAIAASIRALITTNATTGAETCVRCSNSLDRYCALCQNSDTCCCCKLATADAPAAAQPVGDERIWLRRTHEKDGWAFGYCSDKPQDDAFLEYVRADSYSALEKQFVEMKQTRALDKNAWRRVGESLGLTEEESAHTSHVIAVAAALSSTPSISAAIADEATVEALAALCHEQWSGWMKYVFEHCFDCSHGTSSMVPSYAERWQRQMRTSYADLSENEKESDRKEARRILDVLRTLQPSTPSVWKDLSGNGYDLAPPTTSAAIEAAKEIVDKLLPVASDRDEARVRAVAAIITKHLAARTGEGK